jgi:hypothetical protein
VPTRRSVYARFMLLLPRFSPADQTRWWAFQSRKQTASPKKGRLHEKSYPSNDEEQSFPAAKKSIRKPRGTMVGTSDARRKRGKSDPRVQFLVKECVHENEAGCRCTPFYT